MLRTSLLVQRGYLCESCGLTIDEKYSGGARACKQCQLGLESHVAGELPGTAD